MSLFGRILEWFRPEPRPDSGSDFSSTPDTLLAVVNAHRRRRGLPELTRADRLAVAAAAHAADVAAGRVQLHDGWLTRLHGAGYVSGQEVGAWGQRTPQECLDWWLSSPGHRHALEGPSWNVAGCGVVPWPTGGYSWVMILAGGVL